MPRITLLVTSLLLLLVLPAGCASADGGSGGPGTSVPPLDPNGKKSEAIFAGGCFWCVESAFDDLPGVYAAISGFTAGHLDNPTYDQVSAGGTGHAEAVKVVFNPDVVTYEKLLDIFWHNIDPVSAGGQFCDRGSQYRSGIYPLDQAQQEAAAKSLAHWKSSGLFTQPIATEILPAGPFYPAEEYHQDFHKKNPRRYQSYRKGCGRDRRLQEIWGKSQH